MMAVKVGSVTVDLVANTAAFTAGLRTAGQSLGGFGKQVARLQTLLIGGAGIFGTGAVIKSTIDWANALDDLNTRLGFSVEFLSKWQFMAEKSGVNLASVNTAMQRFTRRTAEAAQGTGTLVSAFEALNIDARELAALPADEAFTRWAEALAGVEDKGLRASLAMKGMDTEGVALLQIMDAGADGMAQMAERAEQLGLVLDTRTAKAATEFNARMVDLTAMGRGFVRSATAELLPTLNAMTQQFLTTGGAAAWGAAAGDKFAASLAGIGAAALTASDLIRRARAGVTGLIEAFMESNREGGSAEASMKALSRAWDDLSTSAKSFTENFKTLSGELPSTLTLPEIPGLAGGAAAPAMIDARTTSVQKLTDAQRAHQALLQEGARLMEQARSPAEALAATHERLGELLQVGAIDQRAFNVLLEQARERWQSETDAMRERGNTFDTLMKEQTASAERALEDLEKRQDAFRASWMRTFLSPLQAFMEGTRSAKEAFSDLIADVTGMLTRLAAEQTFRQLFGVGGQGGGGGFTGMLGALGGLFGDLLPGFQHGGDMRVGGAGGSDSQVVAFKATPGERVTVTPSMGAAPSQGFTIVQNITVQGTGRESLEQVGAAAGLAVQSALARNG